MSLVEPPTPKEAHPLEKIFSSGVVTIYKAGEWICGSDQGPCDYLHFIKYGYVKAYSDTSKEHVHIILNSMELFPVLKIINSQDRKVRYSALTKVKIYSVHVDEVIKLLRSDIEFSNSILESVLRLYRIHADRIDNLQLEKSKERVISRLIFLGARFGKKKKDGSILLESFFSVTLISDTLSLSRESVSREISKLENDHYICRTHEGILIKDVRALSEELSWKISNNLWGLCDEKENV